MSDLGTFQSAGPVQFGSIEGGAPISHVTADSAKKVAELGARVVYKGEEYVYVHNACAQDASVGYGMVMSALSGYSLTISSVTGVNVPICVVKHATITAGGFGWGLTRGLAPLALASTMATGVMAVLGTDGVFSTWVVSTGAHSPQAQILSSGTGISTTGLGMGYVKCWG